MIDLKAQFGKTYRITLDPSASDEPRVERIWYYRIPCKYGFIGVHSPDRLLAYCHSNRVTTRLLAIPGVVTKQRGDFETNVIFPIESMDAVVELLQARRRKQVSEAERERLRAMSPFVRQNPHCEGEIIGPPSDPEDLEGS